MDRVRIFQMVLFLSQFINAIKKATCFSEIIFQCMYFTCCNLLAISTPSQSNVLWNISQETTATNEVVKSELLLYIVFERSQRSLYAEFPEANKKSKQWKGVHISNKNCLQRLSEDYSVPIFANSFSNFITQLLSC